MTTATVTLTLTAADIELLTAALETAASKRRRIAKGLMECENSSAAKIAAHVLEKAEAAEALNDKIARAFAAAN